MTFTLLLLTVFCAGDSVGAFGNVGDGAGCIAGDTPGVVTDGIGNGGLKSAGILDNPGGDTTGPTGTSTGTADVGMDDMGSALVDAELLEKSEEDEEEEKEEEDRERDDTDDGDDSDTTQTPSLQPLEQAIPMALNLPSAAQKPSFKYTEVAQ